MSDVILLAHIPCLRIDRDEAAFAQGLLWRMPFDVFNQLTVGAFSDHRRTYEATAPVFYRIDTNIDLPAAGGKEQKDKVTEVKIPLDKWAMLHGCGLGFLSRFHDALVDPAWCALLLAAPAGAFPPPRLSVTFGLTPHGEGFLFGDDVVRSVRAQGDADLEYCFLAETAGPPVPDAIIEKATAHLASLQTITADEELRGAIRILADAAMPLLSPAEQLTLAVMALEDLLMPDVRSQLGVTFSRRLAALLSVDAGHRRELEHAGRVLYDARSASLRGEEPRSAAAAADAAVFAHGQQLLGAAIEALTTWHAAGTTLKQVRRDLDAGAAVTNVPTERLPLTAPVALRPPERLLRGRTSIVAVASDQRMEAPEGVVMNWVPLIGLAGADTFKLGDEPAVVFMPMTGPELLSLEERDIRRDFAAQLYAQHHPIACLSAGEKAADSDAAQALMPALERRRDLAVVALRLAGFGEFHDPELLGTYIFHGHIRYRRPTILRQSLLQDVRIEATQRISAADGPRIEPLWRLLTHYDSSGRHEDIDRVLCLLRRVFDKRFLPTRARAALMMATLEAILGRFRGWKDPVQLECFVTHIMGADAPASVWFVQNGRDFRNAVAHGSWEPDPAEPALGHLLDVLCAVVPPFINAWLQRPDQTEKRPAVIFTEGLTAQLMK